MECVGERAGLSLCQALPAAADQQEVEQTGGTVSPDDLITSLVRAQPSYIFWSGPTGAGVTSTQLQSSL